MVAGLGMSGIISTPLTVNSDNLPSLGAEPKLTAVTKIDHWSASVSKV